MKFLICLLLFSNTIFANGLDDAFNTSFAKSKQVQMLLRVSGKMNKTFFLGNAAISSGDETNCKFVIKHLAKDHPISCEIDGEDKLKLNSIELIKVILDNNLINKGSLKSKTLLNRIKSNLALAMATLTEVMTSTGFDFHNILSEEKSSGSIKVRSPKKSQNLKFEIEIIEADKEIL